MTLRQEWFLIVTVPSLDNVQHASSPYFYGFTALSSIGVHPVRLIPLPCKSAKIRAWGRRVLKSPVGLLQGTGLKRTGRTLIDSNAAEGPLEISKPCCTLSREGKIILAKLFVIALSLLCFLCVVFNFLLLY